MNIDELSINSIRIVGNEAINRANSGHPGMVLGSAGISYVLFNKILKITSKDSKWINRDRFVLASGHASMLLYTNLHLRGYKITMEDIKNFRQLGSLTPGHPEYNYTDGVDCTSGPLGQGIGHGVGMAIAEKFLEEKFNKDDCKIVDNYTYVLCGDGDIEEGVSFESMSIASRLNLNKLIIIYDCNDVTLDGPLSLSSNEKFKDRFKAMNFNVIECNGLDCNEVEKAIKKAKKFSSQPTIIFAHTIIGYLSSKQGDCCTHGSPIKEDLEVIKKKINWNYDPFVIPQEVYEHYEIANKKGLKEYRKWKRTLKEYKEKYPEDYVEYLNAINKNYNGLIYPEFDESDNVATRVAGGKVINTIATSLKTLVSCSSDVAKSVNTLIKDEKYFGLEEKGRNIFFGIREFGMSLAQSGMLLYGGVRPLVGCFLAFSDYMKPSIRTAALMNLPSINIFTHDSIAVGEDGPTHQPIEHISSLRLIPNTVTIRPCGGNETACGLRYAIENKNGPVNLILSRQGMMSIKVKYDDFIKGAYILSKEKTDDFITVIATGSEVDLALQTKDLLKDKIDIRVVSMPSMELFEKQSKKYKKEILGNRRNKIVVIEMACDNLWYKYSDNLYCINSYGASGKASDVMDHFGFTKEKFAEYLLTCLN